MVLCNLCNKQFSNISNLNKHLKNVHKQKIEHHEGSFPNFKCMEGDCTFFSQKNKQLVSHLTDFHNKTFETKELEFPSLTEFKMWKTSMERLEKCMYIGPRVSTSCDAKTYYYYCNRSGSYSFNERRKRLLKSQGSCKLNLNCTSQIKVVEDKLELNCIVTWIKTHYGHSLELQHIRISKEARHEIASKLVMGASTKRILSSNSGKIGEELMRDNLLTSQDVRNVKRSFNIEIADSNRHKGDESPSLSEDNFYNCQQHIKAQYCMLHMTKHPEENNSWVLEEGNRMYHVKKNSGIGSICCGLSCPKCMICIHNFSCGCVDYAMKNIICRHIHYVVMKQNYEGVEPAGTENLVCVQDTDECLKSIAGASESWRDKMLLYLGKVNKHINNYNFEGNDEIEEQIIMHLKSIIILATLKKASVKYGPQTREPANKKMLGNVVAKQLHFKSTQKKRKRKQFLKKPSENEGDEISRMINSDDVVSKNSDTDHNYCR